LMGELIELDQKFFVGSASFLAHRFFNLAPWGVSSMR
jgi:hypothetical protein